MKNGADVESTDMKFAGLGFNSVSPERRKNVRKAGLRKPRVCFRANSRKTADVLGVLSTSREVQGKMIWVDLTRR